MKRILTLLVLTASLLGAQNNSRWIYFFAGVDGSKNYYDSQTVVYRPSDNQYVKVWLKGVESDGAYALIRYELHATTRHIRSLSIAQYSATGQYLNSSNQPTSWDDIVPESVADALLHRLYRLDQPTPPPVVRY